MKTEEEIYEELKAALGGVDFSASEPRIAKSKATAAASRWLDSNGYRNGGLSAKFGSMIYGRALPELKRKAAAADYYRRNRDREIRKTREYREKNHEFVKMCSNSWKKMNRKRCSEYSIKRRKALRNSSAEFRLVDNLGNLVRNSLARNGFKKTSRTRDLIGCDWAEFKAWIESQFSGGMSWEGRGAWHVDHFFPVGRCATQRDAETAFNWRNLRPIPASENCSKRDLLTKDAVLLAASIGISGVKVRKGEHSMSEFARSLGLSVVET